MLTLEQQIELCQAESARLWALAGDETNTPRERYCCAWGALDFDLELELLLEELAKQTSKAA